MECRISLDRIDVEGYLPCGCVGSQRWINSVSSMASAERAIEMGDMPDLPAEVRLFDVSEQPVDVKTALLLRCSTSRSVVRSILAVSVIVASLVLPLTRPFFDS